MKSFTARTGICLIISLLMLSVIAAMARLAAPVVADQAAPSTPVVSARQPEAPSSNSVFLPFVMKMPTSTPSPTVTPTPTQGSGTLTLNDIADAMILEGYADANYGAISDMWAGYDDGLNPNGRIARSLVKFDLSSLPANAIVQNAKLRIFYSGHRDFPSWIDTITAYQIIGEWSEMSVTWNSKPSPGTAYGSVDIPADGKWGWRELDVRSLVRDWQDGSIPNQGLMLRGPELSGDESSFRAFSTREGGYTPQLEITYLAAAAAIQPPTGRATAPAGPRLREYKGDSTASIDATGREQREIRR